VQAGDPALTNVMAAVGATGVMAAGLTQTVPVGAAAGGPSQSEIERKKRTRNLVILLVTLLVVLAVIAFFLLRSLGYIGGTQQVDVPNEEVAQQGPGVVPSCRTVRTDSGWNWTPSTGSSRWRRPMITPSVEVAVTIKLVGHRIGGSTTREW
jgi:hypothetical protein